MSLRTQFCRLLRPLPSGSGDKALTSKQKWILRHLDFLKPFVTPRNAETTLAIDDNDTDTQGTVADDEVSSPGENSLETAPRASTPGPSRSSSPPSPAPRGRRPLNKKPRRSNDSDIELEKLEVLKEMSNTVKFGLNPEKQDRIDDESGFGRQVAVEVNHIKDPILKTRAKKRIMTTLYEFQEADQNLTGRAQQWAKPNDQFNIWSQQTPPQYKPRELQHNETQPHIQPQTSHPTSHHHAYTLPHGQPSYVQLLEDSEDN
ncbi:uncharacterized protein [Paramisgurnus dabryanus]|uniref:uncharacterized protein n=1 Tax=Paramisgurnus dabryanus TaxID=90735 RepID=UPI0031F41AEE